ncbi:SDR family NAD(P)-dependent oxidoreductase [Flavihumibacter petaseus]|uniref:Serine 3-dehydrogenase n=1 Tax=Flavihumibacter petaseus NBRC 106054 TaxID=1220578 RepID=A0A0E9N7A7_9BACT|nr:SDR family NAD(P)-dependent oxidoreductase [Flavihumibacter petaseus]GAO45586.1 serine 3-dehydrogenase [Flavihumibacter petaseus NBRC 106054]
MNNTVWITGASSGFGMAIARKFASAKYNLVITGRRQDKLETLREELETAHGINCHTAVFDVRNRQAAEAAVANLPEGIGPVTLLVNNAGLALGRDYFDEANIDDWETMIDTNLKGILFMTRALLPKLLASGSPHIINIGSIAGKEVYEKGNVYCASKHAVDAISKAMRIDLLRHGVKVTAIHPGAAETEFSIVRFKGDEKTADDVYKGYEPLSAEDIADTVFYCATLPPHVCINDLVITCTAQANSFLVKKG